MSAVEPQASLPSQPPRRPRRGYHHGRPNTQQTNDGDAAAQSAESSGGETPRRRGRGGRNGALPMRPSHLPPGSRPGPGISGHETSRGGQHRSRGGGAPRPQRMVNGREFGGRLTHDLHNEGHDLQASAPEFVPGQPLIPTAVSHQRPVNATRRRRLSKSTAPDILTRTHEDIEHGQYECPICTSEVQRNSKVWSCHTCWTVFHLSCIKKWASNEGSAAARRASISNGEEPPPRQWRCPGCNLPKDEQPKTYTCWCGKETDPRPPTGIPPHSCGNTCGKDRVRKCPHPCQLTCHAGPCPPCTYMGPAQSCFCGKHEATKRCAETDYDNGWSCKAICGDIMPCGVHTCPQPCHEGLCGACEVPMDARCYCGQVHKAIKCHFQGQPQSSARRADAGADAEETWIGTFQCENICERLFDCGVHRCQKPCHSTEITNTHCPRSTDLITHCPCGKTNLVDISPTERRNCEAPILSCHHKCGKLLQCGHACEQVCHPGDCRPCMKTIQVSCICGRTSSSTICHQGKIEPPQCMRVCNANMSCGRHACDERCCTGERKAAERLAIKKKKRPLGSVAPPPADLIEPEHICTRVCGRPLKCGNHTCPELCHKGPCNSCREAIFDELPCHCGRTTLEPPLPCGTKPPPCRFQCERPKACAHPQVQHNCHLDDEACPKCPFLVERRCMCGKKMLKNQKCWLQDVRCGQICGKKLKCGSHFCRKECHKPGDCEDAANQPCKQPCGKPKSVCGHPDDSPCHAPFPCKEDKPCTSKIFITCECQAIKQEAKCGASRTTEGNLNKKLSCTEECARLERNRRLALALNIDQDTHLEGGDHIPYSDETLSTYQQHPQWSQAQEREYRVFADSPEEKRLRFKPMPPAQRAFLHALAEDFGFDSESMDPEPHRHVLLLKTPRFVSAPGKTIAEAVRIRLTQRDLSVSTRPATQGPVPTEKLNRRVEVDEPFNAFVLTSPRFGLVVEEIRAALLSTGLPPHPHLDIHFLPSEEVLLKPTGAAKPLEQQQQQQQQQRDDREATEQLLRPLKPALAALVATNGLGNLQLCAVDASLNILRRESDASDSADRLADGWSRVAAKGGAAPRRPPATAGVGGPNSFSALLGAGQSSSSSAGKVTFARKKEPATPKKAGRAAAVRDASDVVDDWEAEMEAEERRLAGDKDVSGLEQKPTGEGGQSDDGKVATADVEEQSGLVADPAGELRDKYDRE